MLRALFSVVAGYLTVVVVIMGSFTLLWALLGQAAAFHPGTTQVTGTWLAAALPLNLAAAIIGGIVAAWLARSRALAGILGLAGLILVLGVAAALAQTGAPVGDGVLSSSADLTAFEAAIQARQPVWVAWFLPFLGSAGVLAGGGLVLLGRARRGRAIQGTNAPAPG